MAHSAAGDWVEARKRLAQEIMECLNEYRIRATYAAVAEVVYGTRSNAHNVQKRLLGPPRPEGSWIVATGKERPSQYPSHLIHPDLPRNSHVITTGNELNGLLVAYRLGIRAPIVN